MNKRQFIDRVTQLITYDSLSKTEIRILINEAITELQLERKE
jgi:hypothetical protein